MSREVAIGMIGVGPMAALHAAAIAAAPGVRLAACASRDPAKAEAFAARCGGRPTTVDALLDRPDVDALWVVAPADAMAEVAVRAAATGLPLFLEKPVGLDPAETAAAAAAVAVPTMVGLNRRFYEVLRAGRDRIEAAGGLRFIEVHMPEDIAPLAGRYQGKALHNWQFGNSVHLIDLFRFFAGEPVSVTAEPETRGFADRSYLATLRFAGGARGLYSAQWFAPGPWRLVLHADGLSIEYAPIERGVAISAPGRRREEILPLGPDREIKAGLTGQAEAFGRLVATGAPAEGAADLADYLRTVALVAAVTGYASDQDAPTP